MKETHSNIYLLFDIKIFYNVIAIVTIFAYYIDANFKLETILIKLQQVVGSYSGKNVAEQVIQVI